MPSKRKRDPAVLKDLPDDALILLPEVLSLVPLGKTRFLDGARSGEFPPPRKIGPRLNAWPLGDIRALCRGEWKPESKAAQVAP